jgi:hypothetical protein
MEMGFERTAVVNSLNANNGNEEAALNGLLSPSPSAAPPAPVSAQPSGLFGRIWGK